MSTPVGPSYLSAHLAMKHPILAAAGAMCVAALSWGDSDPEKGYVLFTFDDGHKSDYAIAYPTLIDAGFPATAYLVDSNIGKPEHMGWPEINLLNEWERGYHTVTHPELDQVSGADLVAEVGAATSEIKSFASPFGYYNDDVIAAVRNAGYTSHVNAWTDVPENDGLNAVPLADPFNINRLTVHSEMTAEEVCARAPEKDQALVLLFHKIDPNADPAEKWTVSEDMFKAIVACFEGYNTTTVSRLVEITNETASK